MNSIDRNQSEDNHADLSGHAAVQRIKGVVDTTKTCFFCTEMAKGHSAATRPMSVRKVDDNGHLWFLSADDSNKNHELESSSRVDLYFQGSEHSDFLHLNGTASISRDKARIKELWDPLIKTWFTGGVDDPRITVIRVAPESGYYWDNKHGNMVAGVKMMIGAALGKTMDDSIQGALNLR